MKNLARRTLGKIQLAGALLLAGAAAASAACITSAGSWANAPFAPQTGVFTAEFDATPSAAKMDGVAGLSNAAASGYPALAAAVRFNNTGTIDARNGGAYAASARIPYTAGVAYHFRLAVNLPAHTYSAYVKPAGGTEVLIGSNYAFRTEQASVPSLANAGLVTTAGGESACNLAAAGATSPAPPPPPPPATGGSCVTSNGSWVNNPFTPQTGSFTASFDATPSMANMDGVTGLSNGSASGYSALAVAVRFNNAGRIDARNGGAYAAAASVPYTPGVAYHFRLAVNVPSHSYSAYVKPAGGTEILIGSNYSFRTEQAGAASLSNAALLASTGGEAACAIAASGTPAAGDATPPAVSIAAPASGAALTGTVSVTANASDNTGVAGVQFKLDGANLGAEDTAAPYAASWNTAQASDGSHVLTAAARDAAGNVATSAGVAVKVANAAVPPPTTAGFYDNFSTYVKNTCFADGATFGPWRASYSGYGCVKTATDGTSTWLEEAPKASASPGETHASLAVGPVFAAPLTYSINMETVSQLRTGSAPNAWEVAWVFWNYTDDTHFYYFQPKPNGWELGKEDPAYRGAQRFLATGSSPVFPIGRYYNVKIVQNQNVMTVYVDGQLITTFTDNERPYTSGRIGFYNEDSRVRAKDVSVNVAPVSASVAPPANGGVASNLVRAQQRFLSPRLADGVNDSAVFGPEASEVSIFNLRGRKVFHGSRSGAAPIVWRGTDGTGQVVDSGVYVARLTSSDASVLYQSFAVVK